MTKLLPIDSCTDCTHCRFYLSPGETSGIVICEEEEKIVKFFTVVQPHDVGIPCWCPLESAVYPDIDPDSCECCCKKKGK